MKRKIQILIFLIYLCIYLMYISSCSPQKMAKEQTMCGMWVATTDNLDFPSKAGLDDSDIEREIQEICARCDKIGVNTIYLQVRANADALYNNSVFGPSKSIYGQRSVSYHLENDVLQTFIKKAHEYNIQLYAWINPYRIGCGQAESILDSLPENHPAKQYPYTVMTYSDGVAFDPGVPKTRALILDGIGEILDRYDVDGIVFDDYFYPYEGGYDDAETFDLYGKNFERIEDFRRYSVNRLIQDCSSLARDKNISFGVSPFGIWNNKKEDAAGSDTKGLSSYGEIYADSKTWVENQWVDFIAPQIYWNIGNEKADFSGLLSWWSELCEKSDVKLYVSHYVSRIGSGMAGWEDSSQIERQLQLCFDNKAYDGSIFFRYSDFVQNEYNECAVISKYYKEKDE